MCTSFRDARWFVREDVLFRFDIKDLPCADFTLLCIFVFVSHLLFSSLVLKTSFSRCSSHVNSYALLLRTFDPSFAHIFHLLRYLKRNTQRTYVPLVIGRNMPVSFDSTSAEKEDKLPAIKSRDNKMCWF